jgi:hypothetical protein
MVLAGPVFPEWYWGPIFLLLFAGPFLALAAFAVDVAANRFLGPLRLRTRIWLWVDTPLVVVAVVVSVGALRDHLRFERAAATAASAVDFAAFSPQPPPRGLRLETVKPEKRSLTPAYIRATYRGPGDGWAVAFQQRPGPIDVRSPSCRLEALQGTGTSFFEGPCEIHSTPAGRQAFLGDSRQFAAGRVAFAVLEGTLVRLEYRAPLSDRDALAWVDGLRRADPREIDYKGP